MLDSAALLVHIPVYGTDTVVVDLFIFICYIHLFRVQRHRTTQLNVALYKSNIIIIIIIIIIYTCILYLTFFRLSMLYASHVNVNRVVNMQSL